MEQTYWNLQKRLHPDLYGSKSEVRELMTQLLCVALLKQQRLSFYAHGVMQFEKELSAVNAAVINDAYNMLKAPNTRVKYLVRLLFVDSLCIKLYQISLLDMRLCLTACSARH